MSSKIINKIRSNYLAMIVTVLVITSLAVTLLFSEQVKSSYEERIEASLNNSGIGTEGHFVSIMRHTEFILRLMNSQIYEKPYDYKHIENIMNKYRVDPAAANTIPWTYFDWVNPEGTIVVNAVQGVLKPDERITINYRGYAEMFKKRPDTLHFSEPDLGATSKRWLLPTGMGLMDREGKYAGANIVGIDLNNLAAQIKDLQKDSNVNVYIFDSSMNLLIDLSKMTQTQDSTATAAAVDRVRKYIDSNGDMESRIHINLFEKTDPSYVKRMGNLPFYAYISYNAAPIKAEFWEKVTSRIIELLVICLFSIVAIVKLYRIWWRENKMRIELENSYELAMQSTKAKNEFLAYTGHELRSPLNGIMFGSEMIMKKMFGDIHPKYLEYVHDMHQNGQDLLNFIEDLIDATRAEDGNFSLHKEDMDIDECIKRVVNLNSARAAKSGIKIETYIEKGIPVLHADPKRMRQILNNLVSNSVKYSADGSHIKIIVHSIDDLTQIVVEDQGFGMTNEELKVAMSKYGTVDNVNSGKVESIGLGLPLVKNLTEAHGAKFEIESEKNVGTRVTISFALHKQARSTYVKSNLVKLKKL